MKENELRLNNLVKWNDSIQKITAIAFGNCLLDKHPTADYPIELIEIEPIPLNVEILHKIGFEIDSLLDDICFDEMNEIDEIYGVIDEIDELSSFICYFNFGVFRLYIYFLNGKFNRSTLVDREEYETKIPCEFVHQLQNLYFALTNNELTIEL